LEGYPFSPSISPPYLKKFKKNVNRILILIKFFKEEGVKFLELHLFEKGTGSDGLDHQGVFFL
jgi:hypothetical protein